MSMEEYRKNRNTQIVEKIIKYIETIKDYVGETEHQDYIKNKMLREACVFNIFQIGELVNNFKDNFVEIHSHLPLKELRGLRNRIAHGYETVDAEKIWNIIYNDLDTLKENLTKIINDER